MGIGTTSFANNGNTIFGCGAVTELGESLSSLSISRPLIATDKGIASAGLLEQLLERIPSNIEFSLFDETPANPTENDVRRAVAVYRSGNCDGVIAFGGGSSLDLGKAVALAVTHRGPLEQFITQNNGAAKIGPVAPVIAVPTTAGTGSEVARASVLILDSGEKRIIASPLLVPKVAILDPELTLSLPPALTAATGMDAVTHCIEAVLSPVINPSAEAIALAGLSRALGKGALLRAFEDGADRDARSEMLLVSTMGAMGFSKGLGAVHAMSHACGRDQSLRLHHGTLNAVLLPVVLRHNFSLAIDKYGLLSEAIGIDSERSLDHFIVNLNAGLGLPGSLASMGITPDMIPELAAHAAVDMTNATNPVPLDKSGYERLFAEALGT